MMDQAIIDEVIINALKEDIQNGDITTKAIAFQPKRARAEFLIKQNGIIAGIEVCKRVFEITDKLLQFEIRIPDGAYVRSGDIAAVVEGNGSSILTGERTALNFLQRMSGIATTANLYTQKIRHTKAKVLDTRKTVPGLRYFDKLAVKLGGAENHRFGLYDMFLIKDNHIEIARSITESIKLCRNFQKEQKTNFKIEVEVKNLIEAEEALNCGVEIIMIDNFTIEMMKEAVKLIRGRCKIEASGGITIDNITEIAETGVDYISVGALTHSVKGLDISLLIRS
ncbi:MAG: carboxylating nicotinate-nucleotide diphosphorylase [Ignavibacteriaceae bacterium]